ncbi:PAS domain-containing protein [Rhodobacteraceae bacterium D3-12]|nr:PAS domain-containing protein [Rhodobacteraceae bacterium D3-12]
MIETHSTIPQEIGTDSGEVHFPIERILATATDPRGTIQFANPAFCDISGYSNAQLAGAPHKIVRHTDMPRGVFQLMWNRLKAGQSVCAYIKNKTAKGGFYWTLALITQLPEGYISVRIKPSGPLLERAERTYAKLVELEGAACPRSVAK